MHKHLHFVPPCLLSITVIGFLPPAADAQPGAALVPAQFVPFHAMTDGQGYLWDLDQMGRIMNGTDSCFSQSFMLLINNNQFQPNSSLMTPNGCEVVLHGGSVLPGLQVTRRCRVEGKSTGARFVEIFTNVGAAPLRFNASVYLTCGNGMWQSAITDSGKVNPTALDKKETGMVLFNPSQNGCISVALCLAGPSAKVRPAIQPVNNGQPILFSYSINLPPRKMAAIVYGAAQCRLEEQPDAKRVASQLKPFSGSSWVEDLPAEIRRAVINFSGFGSDFQWDDVGIGKVLSRLETNSGPSDILAFGAGTRLKGTAACKAVSLETRFGGLTTSLDKVVAVAGARDHSGRAVVLFRDGQALIGKLRLENFIFTLNSGLQIEAASDHLERLYMRATYGGTEAVGAALTAVGADDRGAMLQTTEGERLALAATGKETIALASPWGRFEFPLDELAWVSAIAEPPGHRAVLRDGTRLFGYLAGGPLKLPTRSFGVQSFSPLEVQAIRGFLEREIVDDPLQRGEPCVVLSGDNLIIGRIDLPVLHVVAAGQTIAFPPGQIRKFHAVDAGPHTEQTTFEVELWDGSKLAGKLAEGMLPVRRGGVSRQVPTRDVVEIYVPSPTLSDATRNRIAELIRDLGSYDFSKRKSARAALAELGALAQAQLEEAFQHTSDAEVRRTTHQILDEMSK
jgi:hypothetical protein